MSRLETITDTDAGKCSRQLQKHACTIGFDAYRKAVSMNARNSSSLWSFAAVWAIKQGKLTVVHTVQKHNETCCGLTQYDIYKWRTILSVKVKSNSDVLYLSNKDITFACHKNHCYIFCYTIRQFQNVVLKLQANCNHKLTVITS